jgi:O-methyltransferase
MESTLPIPDEEFYQPTFSPWLGHGEFRGLHERASQTSLVTADRCYVLYCLAKQAIHLPGEFWECGVYKGGTASLLAEVLFRQNRSPLRLFDTFSGMPVTDASHDLHDAGAFGDTSVEAVRLQVGHENIVSFHPGFMPDTFRGLENSAICFAHVDVDIYRSVLDCCAFIYPRLVKGGFMVFDDYGFGSCPGARAGVDQFFQGTGIVPLVLLTGQALVFKSFP